MKKLSVMIVGLVVLALSCRDAYHPKVTSLDQTLLVVEGVLNAGGGLTTIHLTRSSKLDETTTVDPEVLASVAIQAQDNTIYNLFESGNGYYQAFALPVDLNQQYRLLINTASGKGYTSDYVKPRITPPIDSIGYDRNEDGVQLYVNSKDPNNATRYYRWEYEETWEIRSQYASDVIYENGAVRRRIFPQEDVSVCFKYNNSTNLILGNTVRLSEDNVFKQPLRFVEKGDDRMTQRYSILVREYALDKPAFDFLDLMRRNSEDIGSIFSPQPSEPRGNIHSVSDPNELVVGYFSASSVTEKRVFIDAANDIRNWGYHLDCDSKRVFSDPDSVKLAFDGGALLPYYFNNPPGDFYLGSQPPCVDCRVRGGSTARPSYW